MSSIEFIGILFLWISLFVCLAFYCQESMRLRHGRLLAAAVVLWLPGRSFFTLNVLQSVRQMSVGIHLGKVERGLE